MKKLIILLVVILLFTSCAGVVNVQECIPIEEHIYGFWAGLWHGMTVLFSFIGNIFSDDIAIYAVNNNGMWYDFGYFLGVGSLGGSLKIRF